jgi:hypothetical protein
MYKIVKIFSNKLPIQKRDGVLKSVPALVRKNSTWTFPQKKLIFLKVATSSSYVVFFTVFRQHLKLRFGIKI